jgi:ferredoxin
MACTMARPQARAAVGAGPPGIGPGKPLEGAGQEFRGETAPAVPVTVESARSPDPGRPVLRVDPIACGGRGRCAELLPELISLDDWGFPMVADRGIPAHLAADARATVKACPLLALRLDRSPGAT